MSRTGLTVARMFGQRVKNGGQGVGIEIEVEGHRLVNQDQEVRNWTITTDGSLRGEAFEYVLKGPLDLGVAKTALVALEDALKANRAVVNTAHRGSVHVHVNCQAYTLEQIFTILYLWLIVEPLWMHMSGPQRDGNLFCLPSYLSGDMTFYSEGLLASHREGGAWNIINRGKYSALNTDCLTTFGSLEFRTFSSQTDAEVVSDWVDWCHNLVTKGADIDITHMERVWQVAVANPRAFFGNIFPKELPFTDEELQCILEQGIDAASSMLIVANHHLNAPKKAD